MADKDETLTIRISKRDKELLRQFANEEGRSISNLLTRWIKEEVDNGTR